MMELERPCAHLIAHCVYLELQHFILVVDHLHLQLLHGCRGEGVAIRRILQGNVSCGLVLVILNIAD